MLLALLVSLLSLMLPYVGSQNATDSDPATSAPGSADQGRILVGGKPILVYPAAAPTRHQLIVGVGVPVQELPHSVVFGWVLKAQYYLPSLPSDYDKVYVENWNESRRAMPERTSRSVQRYEVDNVSVRVEPLPPDEIPPQAYSWPEEDENDEDLEEKTDGLKNVWSYWRKVEEDNPTVEDSPNSSLPPPASEGYHSPYSRWMVYKAIEQLSDGYGFGGRVCMLRSICESAEAPFTHTGGVFAELLHVMFSPSTTNEPVSEHRDNEYFRAEQLGRSGAPCAEMFRECSTSLLDMFSGVHDIYPETSSFFSPPPFLPVDPILPMR